MSDGETRAAERRAALDGDTPEFLARRLRAGELTEERIRLAASCGSAAARALMPCPEHPPNTNFVTPPRFGRRKGNPKYGHGCLSCTDQGPLSEWCIEMSKQASECAPFRTKTVCGRCQGLGYEVSWNNDHVECASPSCVDGKRPRIAHAEAYLAMLAGVAVAKVCLENYCPWGASCQNLECERPAIQHAIIAAEVWLRDLHVFDMPHVDIYTWGSACTLRTEEPELAWAPCRCLLDRSGDTLVRLLDRAAVRLADEKRVREIVATVYREWALS